MSNDINDQVIALAAIFQCAAQVEQLATTGHLPSEELEIAVNSLFVRNPDSTLEVYGTLAAIERGLQTIVAVLRRNSLSASNNCIRYVMGILHLQKQLAKHASMSDIIASRLEKTRQQIDHFSPTHDNVIASLADIYGDTISTFKFRIQVSGEYQYLQQARIAAQIRTLLFAGIRSAVLWRQLGGSRLQVIFKRKKLLQTAEELLAQAKAGQLH